jgi:hypothetical protein
MAFKRSAVRSRLAPPNLQMEKGALSGALSIFDVLPKCCDCQISGRPDGVVTPPSDSGDSPACQSGL